MKIVLILGGLGEAYVESRGTKRSRRHHHTGYMCTTRKNNGNHGRGQKFYIYVQILTSLAIWGPGGGGGGCLNNQTGPILVHIYTLYLIIIYMSNIEAI